MKYLDYPPKPRGFRVSTVQRAWGDAWFRISVLYPQIEGVLRSLFVDENPGTKAEQDKMVGNLVDNKLDFSVLLPKRFAEFLMKVYFRSFDLKKGDIPLSRHTIAHGVSTPASYDFLTSAIGFLVLDQFIHYLSD